MLRNGLERERNGNGRLCRPILERERNGETVPIVKSVLVVTQLEAHFRLGFLRDLTHSEHGQEQSNEIDGSNNNQKLKFWREMTNCGCPEKHCICLDCGSTFLTAEGAAHHEEKHWHPGRHWLPQLTRRARDVGRRGPARFAIGGVVHGAAAADAAADAATADADSSSDDERIQDSDDDGESDVELELSDTVAAPAAAAAAQAAVARATPAAGARAAAGIHGDLDALPDLEMPSRKRAATTDAAIFIADDDDKGFLGTMNRDPDFYKHIVVSKDKKRWSCKFCYATAVEADWPLTYGKTSRINEHIETKMHQKSKDGMRQASFTFVPELDQAHFEALLVDAIIECNLPFSIGEKPAFRKLVMAGKERSKLKIMSRQKVSQAVSTRYDQVKARVSAAIARKRLHLSFDLWSDPTGRGWLGVNGHFFNDDLKLLNVCLVFKYLPKTDTDTKHTGERIYDVLTTEIKMLAGDDPIAEIDFKRFSTVVVDGGSNVGKAARMLVGKEGSRRCVSHALQLVLKYATGTIKEIAEAVSASNYMASRSKISQHFAGQVGRFSTGTKTRWNSYLRLADQIYKARKSLALYSQNDDRESAKFDVQFDVLARGGFAVLHDVCKLLMPLMAIAIEEEGERYITSSFVIPRLNSALDAIKAMFTLNKLQPPPPPGPGPAQGFVNPAVVRRWEAPMTALFDAYLKPFFGDELLLTATLLDSRCGIQSLPSSLLPVAAAALKNRLIKVHARLSVEHALAVERWRHEQESDREVPLGGALPQDRALNHNVAAARAAQVQDHVHTAEMLDDLFGGGAPGQSVTAGGPIPTFRSVDEEMAVLKQLPRLAGTADPMQLYRKESKHKLVLATEVAIDVLAAPAGEAPVERDFSVATHVLGKSRFRLKPASLEQLVFSKRNSKSMNL